MKCVLCHRNCRNACSRGNHGWCANCRDASGFLECSRCRSNKAAKYQQSKQAAAQSRAAIAAANAPVYIPTPQFPPITAPVRKLLSQMSEDELESWAQSIDTALDDMVRRISTYTNRRQSQGKYTPTDAGIERDIMLAEDIKAALSELPMLWRMAHTSVSLGSSSPPTGMLIDYDTLPGGKVKP